MTPSEKNKVLDEVLALIQVRIDNRNRHLDEEDDDYANMADLEEILLLKSLATEIGSLKS